jgi:hypothetical protein
MTRTNYGESIASHDATVLRDNALLTETDIDIGHLAYKMVGRYLPAPSRSRRRAKGGVRKSATHR